MKPFDRCVSIAAAALSLAVGWTVPLTGGAALLAASPAQAQADCTYHVGPPGQGDWVECPPDSPRPRPRVEQPDVWGAIAATPGGGWGSSFTLPSESAARAEALRQCRINNPGNTGCRVLRTVADVCLALVASEPDRMLFVGGPIGAANFATDNAQLQCRRAGGRACRLKTMFCADGQRHILRGETVFSNGNPIYVPNGGGAFGRR